MSPLENTTKGTSDTKFDGQMGKAVGWGKISENPDIIPNTPYEVDLEIEPRGNSWSFITPALPPSIIQDSAPRGDGVCKVSFLKTMALSLALMALTVTLSTSPPPLFVGGQWRTIHLQAGRATHSDWSYQPSCPIWPGWLLSGWQLRRNLKVHENLLLSEVD